MNPIPYWELDQLDGETRAVGGDPCAAPPCAEWVNPYVSPGAGAWFDSRSYAGVMGIPAANRAISLLTGVFVQMPLKGYRDRAGRPTERIDPTPSLLIDPGAGRDTRSATMSALALDYFLNGNAVGIWAERDSVTGWPVSMVPVPAQLVGVGLDRDSSRVKYSIGDQVYDEDDVFHVKGLCEPGQLRGMSILESACRSFGLATEEISQAASISQAGVPTGLLQATNPDITTADLKSAKAAWLENQRRRSIAALAPGVTFTPLSWNPEEMQLVQARQRSTQDIAMLFGIPLRYFGEAVGGLSYSNPGSDSADLVKFALDQHLIRFEEEFSRHLPRGNWASFDRNAILRGDTAGRYAAYTVGLTAGFLTMEEVRAWEDLPPLVEDEAPEEPEAEETEEPEDDTPDAPAEEEGETGGDSDTDLAQVRP